MKSLQSQNRKRSRCLQLGVTLPEAIVACAVLALVMGTAFAALLRSYSIANEARYYDEARNVINAYVAQFQSLPFAKEDGSYRDFWEKTGETQEAALANATGSGLSWDGVVAGPSGPFEITLFDGGDPKVAQVTRAVWQDSKGALGPLLVAQFSIRFNSAAQASHQEVPVGLTITVARAIVSDM